MNVQCLSDQKAQHQNLLGEQMQNLPFSATQEYVCGRVTNVTSEAKSKTDSLLWFNFCDPTNLVFSEAGHWVVGAGTVIIGASVDGLPRVVNLLVVPQMILASKRSVTDITEKSLCLTVDQNVPLQLELWRELLVTIWKKKFDQDLSYAIWWVDPPWILHSNGVSPVWEYSCCLWWKC